LNPFFGIAQQTDAFRQRSEALTKKPGGLTRATGLL
jgi:hypothetical protein